MGNKLKIKSGLPRVLNSEIKFKKIAIDGTLMLHQVLYANRVANTGEYFKSKSGVITSHLYGLTTKLAPFLKHGVNFVFVMDGCRNPLKTEECKRRAQQTELKLQMLMDYISEGQENSPDAIRIKKSINYITADILDTTRKLIGHMGGFYHVAKQEAEAQCADLVNRKLCDIVWSDDSDTPLYFNNPKSLWLSKVKILKNDITGQMISADKIYKDFEMTQKGLVSMALMAGTDYSRGISKVGPVNALKLIKKYENLETVIKNCQASKLVRLGPWKKIQKNFMAPVVSNIKSLEFKKLNILTLSQFLESHDISYTKIKKIILSTKI